jgi:hypothetical protein
VFAPCSIEKGVQATEDDLEHTLGLYIVVNLIKRHCVANNFLERSGWRDVWTAKGAVAFNAA